MVAHPLLEVFRRAAGGEFPTPDGSVEVVPVSAGLVASVVAFTAHHYIAADVDFAWVGRALGGDTIAGPLTSAFIEAWREKSAPRQPASTPPSSRLGLRHPGT